MASPSAAPAAVSSSHDHSHDHAHADDGMVHAHVADPKFYLAIFGALIVLTAITVGVSYIDFGSGNTVIALVVATMKASLVAAFFMHLTHDKLFNTICLLSAFLFLGVFFTLTYEDTSHRNQLDEVNGSHTLMAKGEAAPGGMPSAAPAPAAEKKAEGHAEPKAGETHH